MEKPLNLKVRNKAITTFMVACIMTVILIFYHVIISQMAYNTDSSPDTTNSSTRVQSVNK